MWERQSGYHTLATAFSFTLPRNLCSLLVRRLLVHLAISQVDIFAHVLFRLPASN